jgi:hypothetical protein
MAGGNRRLLAGFCMAAAALVAVSPSRAQTDDAPSVVKSYMFSFDFTAPPSEAAILQEVQLHYSIDQGKTWKLYRGVPPSDGKITFEASGDGEYWFAVQQVYKDGRRRPSKIDGATTPQRKVIVDTTPPRVELSPVSGGGKVGVEWSIRGEDVDLSSLRLEARLTTKREWMPVSVTPTRTGRKTWEPEQKGDHEVRLRVVDRAGNETSRNVFANPNRSANARLGGDEGDSLAEPPPPGNLQENGSRPAAASKRGVGRLVAESNAPSTPTKAGGVQDASKVSTYYVNKLKFQVNYKLEALGKSGCKAVQLFWRYPDSDDWTDYGANAEEKPPFKVQVTGEGKYGIRLRAVSGVGLAEDLPQPGAPPQLWVVVDITPPTVQLDMPKVKFGGQPEVLFSWQTTDENLGQNKVKLSYAAVDGPDANRWKEIAKNLPENGKHTWKPPAETPYRFNVRIDVEDAAGNTAHDETTETVSIDDSRPKAIATAVEAVGDGEPVGRNASAPVRESGAPPSPRKQPSLDPDDLSPAVEFGKKSTSGKPAELPAALPKKTTFP